MELSANPKTDLFLLYFANEEALTFTDGFPGYGGSRTFTVLRNSCPAGHFYRLTPKCPHFYPIPTLCNTLTFRASVRPLTPLLPLLAHIGDSLGAGETRRAAVAPTVEEVAAGGVRGSEPQRPGVAAADAGRPSPAPLSLRCAVAALR